jgi:hypothetical protein
MQPVIRELYQTFLNDSADPESREYADLHDEIAANFVHANYMSSADLKHCVGFDLSVFHSHPHFGEIQELHQALRGLMNEEMGEVVA